MTLHQYAVVDRAIIPDLLDNVTQYEASAFCLYPEPVEDSLAKVAPYLVLLTAELKAWLIQQHTPWGFVLLSSAGPNEVRLHLRKLLNVIVEELQEPILCRYYDPRILWSVLDSLDMQRLNDFMGPIDTVKTYHSLDREASFQDQRAPYQAMPYQCPQPFPLTQNEYQKIITQCQTNLIDQVHTVLSIASECPNSDNQNQAPIYTVRLDNSPLPEPSSIPTEPTNITLFSKQLVCQLAQWEITVVKHVMSIAQLCLEHNIRTWQSFPTRWQQLLADTDLPADYRIKTLISYHTTNLGSSENGL